MAPNRKSIVAFENSLGELENLQSKLQPTYLPLTHPDELSEQGHLPATTQEDSLSYWEWPSVAMMPSTSHVLSSDNVMSNLIRASRKKNVWPESSTVADHDAYWAEEGN